MDKCGCKGDETLVVSLAPDHYGLMSFPCPTLLTKLSLLCDYLEGWGTEGSEGEVMGTALTKKASSEKSEVSYSPVT